jgi:protein TonB
MYETEQSALEPEAERTGLKRLGVVVIPAGLITISLFTVMHQLVAVDEFTPPEQTVYELQPYMEAEIAEPPARPERKLVRPDPIDPPPLPPRLVKYFSKVDLPISGYEGIAPFDYGATAFAPMLPKRVSAISVRTMQPVTQPVPVYPRRAAERGLEGDCNVYLSVSMRGEPLNVQAECTDRVFESAARKAVQRVKFVPQIRDGLPVKVTGVVYPLEFRMQQ